MKLSTWQKIKKWFGFHPHDWRDVWSDSGYYYRNTDDNIIGRCHFRIQFSESRDFFRFITEGYRPIDHNLYGDALQKLAEYNNNLLEIRFKDKAKRKKSDLGED
jgi:hypothetical protein